MTYQVPTAPPVELVQAATQAAADSGVPVHLLIGMCWTESRYDQRAVSARGARGPFQLMPATARELGVTDPTSFVQSAAGVARFLRRYHDVLGGWAPALAAYVWGPGNVTRNRNASLWPLSVRQYVAFVKRAAEDVTAFVPTLGATPEMILVSPGKNFEGLGARGGSVVLAAMRRHWQRQSLLRAAGSADR